jgi:curved DNA-binding protein
MEYKDYYKSLGVNRNASQDEIRDAFRKLARQYHPDKNKGDKRAEEKFKEINEANQVLSDPEKRKKYDQFGSNWEQFSRAGGRAEDFDWNRWGARPGGTRVNVEDLFGGAGGGFSDFFEALLGGGLGGAPRRAARGQNVEQEVEITLEEAYRGTTRVFQGDEGRFEVNIPKGVSTGSRVRVAGKGSPGMGGQAGDLYLRVVVRQHPVFAREKDNLRATVNVDLYTALLGGEVSVPTLERRVLLTIEPGTPNGKTIRLRGKGMPNARKGDTFGDLLATINVTLPEKLTGEEKKLFEKLRKMRSA